MEHNFLQYLSKTWFRQLFGLPLDLTHNGMALSIRSGVGKGMLWCTGEHTNDCFATFSPAGRTLNYLPGQHIYSKSFFANKFIASAK